MSKRSECLGGNECTICNPRAMKAPSRLLGALWWMVALIGVGITTWLVWRAWGHVGGLGVGVVSMAWVSSYMDRWI